MFTQALALILEFPYRMGELGAQFLRAASATNFEYLGNMTSC